jgi:hypothetical protein
MTINRNGWSETSAKHELDHPLMRKDAQEVGAAVEAVGSSSDTIVPNIRR